MEHRRRRHVTRPTKERLEEIANRFTAGVTPGTAACRLLLAEIDALTAERDVMEEHAKDMHDETMVQFDTIAQLQREVAEHRALHADILDALGIAEDVLCGRDPVAAARNISAMLDNHIDLAVKLTAERDEARRELAETRAYQSELLDALRSHELRAWGMATRKRKGARP